MDAFVKAAREAFKDENIGTKELFKLMEEGKLLSKDILPLVGKHMSAAARKGGALEKMLHGNMVAMNRLRMTWQNFQNQIFMGGFGEALTRVFNNMAGVLKQNNELAKTFGYIIGELMKGFEYFALFTYDTVRFVSKILYDNLINPLMELLGIQEKVASSWLLQATGALIAFSAFSKLAKVLLTVLGALTGISKLKSLIPKDLLPDSLGKTGGAASGKGGGLMKSLRDLFMGMWMNKGSIGEALGKGAKIGGPLALAAMALSPSELGNSELDPAWVKAALKGTSGAGMLPYGMRDNYVTKEPMLTITVDGSEFSKILKAELDGQELRLSNTLAP